MIIIKKNIVNPSGKVVRMDHSSVSLSCFSSFPDVTVSACLYDFPPDVITDHMSDPSKNNLLN